MLKLILALTLLSATAPPAVAEAEAPPLESDPQKIAYLIGRNMGQGLVAEGLTVDIEALLLGIREAYACEASRVGPEEAEQLMVRFQSDMNQRDTRARTAAAAENPAKEAAFMEANGKREGVTTTASGLQYEILVAGDGPIPGPTDSITVHYRGTRIDGSVFESTLDRGAPAQFALEQTLDGWYEALQRMPAGSTWKIFVPSALAFGEDGAHHHAPFETLIFEIELISVQPHEARAEDGTAAEAAQKPEDAAEGE